MIKRLGMAAILALLSTAALAQGRCENDADGLIDGARCIQWTQRMYSTDSGKGIEEDSVVGIETADVTLTKAQLVALPTTRVGLVDAPGAGAYLFVDWVVLIKTGAAAAATVTPPASTPFALLASTPATGGTFPTLDIGTRSIVSISGRGTPISAFVAGNVALRNTTGFQWAPAIENEAISLVVPDAASTSWVTAMNGLDADATLRIIVRYRRVDAATVFN